MLFRSLSNGGRVIAGQFDDPYQLDEKGIFDLVNLSHKAHGRQHRALGRHPDSRGEREEGGADYPSRIG